MNNSPGKNGRPKAPRTLSREAKRWWKRLTNEFVLDDQAAVLLLEIALVSFDEMRAAQGIVAEQGLTTKDRFGQMRANPAAAIVRDARLGMLRAFKALNLDVDPPRPGSGRPPGSAAVG